MGFNTVAFILNDHMHWLEKAPHALTFALCHPPMSDERGEMASWLAQVNSVAQDHNEPRIHLQDFRVLPTFHADERRFLFAGQNDITRLEPVKFGWMDHQTRPTVTLELPKWWTYGLPRKK